MKTNWPPGYERISGRSPHPDLKPPWTAERVFWGVFFAVSFLLFAGTIWAAIHFISKYW